MNSGTEHSLQKICKSVLNVNFSKVERTMTRIVVCDQTETEALRVGSWPWSSPGVHQHFQKTGSGRKQELGQARTCYLWIKDKRMLSSHPGLPQNLTVQTKGLFLLSESIPVDQMLRTRKRLRFKLLVLGPPLITFNFGDERRGDMVPLVKVGGDIHCTFCEVSSTSSKEAIFIL